MKSKKNNPDNRQENLDKDKQNKRRSNLQRSEQPESDEAQKGGDENTSERKATGENRTDVRNADHGRLPDDSGKVISNLNGATNTDLDDDDEPKKR